MNQRACKLQFVVAAIDGNEDLRALHVTDSAQHGGRLVIEDCSLCQSEGVLLVKGQHHCLSPEKFHAFRYSKNVANAGVKAVQFARPALQFQS